MEVWGRLAAANTLGRDRARGMEAVRTSFPWPKCWSRRCWEAKAEKLGNADISQSSPSRRGWAPPGEQRAHLLDGDWRRPRRRPDSSGALGHSEPQHCDVRAGGPLTHRPGHSQPPPPPRRGNLQRHQRYLIKKQTFYCSQPAWTHCICSGQALCPRTLKTHCP